MESVLTVSQCLEICNDVLSDTLPSVVVEGEVAGFKTSQGKWVFFDLKDEAGSMPCFMPIWQLRIEIADGMKVRIRGNPGVTKWGRFSFTAQQIMPVGEGSIKKSFELLKKKLGEEGLFDPAKKRSIPDNLMKIGVISSTGAAGYADFCKIINERWGGLEIQVCNVQVQGMAAPEQIVRALKYLNEKAEVQIIAIMRGGGSADDLSAFNDEVLAREIAASRIPVITGIGHEVDESLADLAADIRASTPSNVAERLTPDRRAEISKIRAKIDGARSQILQSIKYASAGVAVEVDRMRDKMKMQINQMLDYLEKQRRVLKMLEPNRVLKQGYAIMSGVVKKGNVVKITTFTEEISAEILEIKARKEQK